MEVYSSSLFQLAFLARFHINWFITLSVVALSISFTTSKNAIENSNPDKFMHSQFHTRLNASPVNVKLFFHLITDVLS